MSPPCGAWHPPCPRAALLPSRERGVGSLSAPIPLFGDTTCLHCRGGFCWYPTPAANPSPGTAGAHCLLLEHPSSPRDCQLWGTHPIGKPAGAGTCPGRPGKETLGLFCKSSWDGSQGAGGGALLPHPAPELPLRTSWPRTSWPRAPWRGSRAILGAFSTTQRGVRCFYL